MAKDFAEAMAEVRGKQGQIVADSLQEYLEIDPNLVSLEERKLAGVINFLVSDSPEEWAAAREAAQRGRIDARLVDTGPTPEEASEWAKHFGIVSENG